MVYLIKIYSHNSREFSSEIITTFQPNSVSSIVRNEIEYWSQ